MNKKTLATNKRYKRGLKGVLSSLRNAHLWRSKLYGYTVTYSLEDLQKRYLGDPLFRKLHKEWRMSGYGRWQKPSLDRIDAECGYSLDNLQLMTWRENWEKGKKEWAKKNCKPILMYTKAGNLVRRFSSIKEAATNLGIHSSTICAVCGDKTRTAKDFYWQHES